MHLSCPYLQLGRPIETVSSPAAIIDELTIWNSVALTADQVVDVFYALGENFFF